MNTMSRVQSYSHRKERPTQENEGEWWYEKREKRTFASEVSLTEGL